ncbi:DUF5069 domain-containing protein [Haloferula sargassicola]|uniref:DUF5069 domain-containing protein n=1 Tax=Haloferula sargassicola TaxID=490096 RepID=A0ABP9UM15_9BACT
MADSIPCSPLLETAGMLYFPRLCDKVRLHQAGELHRDYLANLGSGMDLWTCQFLGVGYDDLAAVVRDGASNEAALAWAREHGSTRPEHEVAWWRAYMTTRGFRDDLSERLSIRKREAGFAEREDILTFMDFIEADEGRL